MNPFLPDELCLIAIEKKLGQSFLEWLPGQPREEKGSILIYPLESLLLGWRDGSVGKVLAV